MPQMDTFAIAFTLPLWTFAILQSVECLLCVKCSSMFNLRCKDGDLMPESCSKNESFCITYEGTPKGSKDKIIIRDCTSERNENGCAEKLLSDREVYVCFNVCQTDGCNGAETLISPNFVLVLCLCFFILIQGKLFYV